MDRRTALDQLELARPDATDFDAADFAEAREFLGTDEAAQLEFERRQHLDREIADAMIDVPIPDGLHDRLLAAVAESDDVEPAAETTSKMSRRGWWVAVSVAAAVCVLVGVRMWYLFAPLPMETVTLVDLELAAPYGSAEWSQLPDYNAGPQKITHGWAPQLPGDVWGHERLFSFSESAKGLLPGTSGFHRAAAYEFTFRDPRRSELGDLQGMLVVVPKEAIEDVPENESVLVGTYHTNQNKPGLAIHSWTEGDSVYLCFVPIEHFDSLINALNPPTA